MPLASEPRRWACGGRIEALTGGSEISSKGFRICFLLYALECMEGEFSEVKPVSELGHSAVLGAGTLRGAPLSEFGARQLSQHLVFPFPSPEKGAYPYIRTPRQLYSPKCVE